MLSNATIKSQRGQAMTELIVVMPVIALFFAAVFYFGYGTNQKIENVMAVHHAAFVYGTDKGRDPDVVHAAVTSDELRSQFFTRGRTVSLTQTNWRTPQLEYAAFAFNSFSTSRRFFGNNWWAQLKWLPNDLAGIYLAGTGLPAGAYARTRTTITLSGVGFGDPLSIGSKTIEAELYVDQKTRKLETASFNYDPDDPWDPTGWDFGYLPVMGIYMLGWDWDFASNCFSTIKRLDTPWLMNPC